MASQINIIGSYGWADSSCKQKGLEGYKCEESSLKKRALDALANRSKESNPPIYSPDTDDFSSVVNKSSIKLTPKTPPDIFSLAYLIKAAPAPVDRVNIITHADNTGAYMKGTIQKNGIPSMDLKSGITGPILRKYDKHMFDYDTGEIRDKEYNPRIDRQVHTLDQTNIKFEPYQVRRRFAKNSRIIMYCCNAGMDPILVKEISRVFGVTVIAFKTKIRFQLSFDREGNFNGIKIGTETNVFDDFNKIPLDPGLEVIKYPL
jgi:hypothetical protein